MSIPYKMNIIGSNYSIEKFMMAYNGFKDDNGTTCTKVDSDGKATIWVNGTIVDEVYARYVIDESEDGLIVLVGFGGYHHIVINKHGEIIIDTSRQNIAKELLDMEFCSKNSEVVIEDKIIKTRNLRFKILDIEYSKGLVGKYVAIKASNTPIIKTLTFDIENKRWVPGTHGNGHMSIRHASRIYAELSLRGGRGAEVAEMLSSDNINKRAEKVGLSRYIQVVHRDITKLFDSENDLKEVELDLGYCATLDGVYVLAYSRTDSGYGILKYDKEEGRLINVLDFKYKDYSLKFDGNDVYIIMINDEQEVSLRLVTSENASNNDIVDIQRR